MAVPYIPRLLFPANNESIDASRTIRFSWLYGHPENDPQTRFHFRTRAQGATSWQPVDSVASPNTFYDRPAGTFPTGVVWEWQVRTSSRSSLDVFSDWSSSGFFFAATPVTTHRFTAPPVGATVNSLDFEWFSPDQDQYQFQITGATGNPDALTVYFDTGMVSFAAGGSTDRSISVPFDDLAVPIPHGSTVQAALRVRTDGLWSAATSQVVVVSYTPPRTPIVKLDIDNPAGAITVESVDPAPFDSTPPVVDHVVLRRVIGTVGWNVVRPRPQVPFPANGKLVDYSAASAQAYEYHVVAIAANGTSAASVPVSEQWQPPVTYAFDPEAFDPSVFDTAEES